MSARGRAAGAAVAWVLVVSITSTLVWVVISRAGQGLVDPAATGDPASSRTGQSLRSPTSREPSSPPAPAIRRSPTPSEAATTSPAPVPSPPTSSAPATAPAQPPPPSAAHPSSAPSPTSTSTTAKRGTWHGAAGVVVVECRDSAIRLVGAQPNSGWAVEVGDRGPEEVEVKFREKKDEGREIEVQAECRGGTPHFSTE